MYIEVYTRLHLYIIITSKPLSFEQRGHHPTLDKGVYIDHLHSTNMHKYDKQRTRFNTNLKTKRKTLGIIAPK